MRKRLTHEVSVIKNMGYVDYHLVVRDFCFMGRVLGKVPKDMRDKMPDDFSKIESWVKENGFNDGEGIGPGRGPRWLTCMLLAWYYKYRRLSTIFCLNAFLILNVCPCLI